MQYQSISSPAKDPPEPRFTIFSNLPFELQDEIWMWAANVPRNVDIWTPTMGHMSVKGMASANEASHESLTYTKTPAMLQVSRRAREIGLFYYKLKFGLDIQFAWNLECHIPPHIYINIAVDRLCLMGHIDPIYASFVDGLDVGEGPKRPMSIALNVFQSNPNKLPAFIEYFFRQIEYSVGCFPDDIILYYMEGYTEPLIHPDAIQFVPFQENPDPHYPHWGRLARTALENARNFLTVRKELMDNAKRESLHNEFFHAGREVPGNIDVMTFGSLRISFACLEVNGSIEY